MADDLEADYASITHYKFIIVTVQACNFIIGIIKVTFDSL